MTIDLNTYLTDAGIPLDKTLVMRHTPTEKSLLKRLPIWAASKPEMYNNYQSNQNPVQEKQLSRATHLASFIGMKTGEALFVGTYKVEGWKEIPVAAAPWTGAGTVEPAFADIAERHHLDEGEVQAVEFFQRHLSPP